jgi:oligopeptide transport system substrate-binding protein
MRVADSLFEGLIRLDKDGRPVPGMAESWDISEDGLRYTFHLRPQARWDGGDSFTAADIVDSWRRVLEPATASPYCAQLYPVRGARAFNEGRNTDFSRVGVKAADARTVVVELESPTPYFLDLCAFITLAPVHRPTLEAHGDRWTKPGNLLGNGPYRLVEWRLNDRIRLEKNPFYWDAANVALATIDIMPVGEPNTAMNFFLTGAVDLIMDKGMIPNTMVDVLREKPYFHGDDFLGTYFLRFNVTKSPFDDARVRRAFAMAIDRRRIVEKITRLGERVAASLVPPGTGDDYQPPASTAGFDPAAARAALAAAGFPDGKGFPLIEYLYMAKSVETHIAVELQSMWSRHLGVNVALTKQEAKVYYASMGELSYDICRSSWVGDYNDPNTFIEMFVTGGGNNRTGYASARFDALVDAAAREPDPKRRYAIFREAEQRLISEDAVIAPIYHYVGVQFYYRDRLGGLEANLIDVHPFREMYWKDGSVGRVD